MSQLPGPELNEGRCAVALTPPRSRFDPAPGHARVWLEANGIGVMEHVGLFGRPGRIWPGNLSRVTVTRRSGARSRSMVEVNGLSTIANTRRARCAGYCRGSQPGRGQH